VGGSDGEFAPTRTPDRTHRRARRTAKLSVAGPI
jgi:hypothetical protein